LWSVGFRVIVPFGTNKQYSGIILRIHADAPNADFKVKEIIAPLENHTLLTPEQLKLWQWMSNYYMCPLGDVYKAAIPSGLRMESETAVNLLEDFDNWESLKPKELQAFELLQGGKAKNVAQLRRAMNDDRVLDYVRGLMDKGALTIRETIESSFRPRREIHVRLAKPYLSEDALSKLFEQLERTPKRFQLLLKYAEMAGLSSAFTLKNEKLIQEVSKADLLRNSGISAAVLVALRSKGIFETYDFDVTRLQRTGVSVAEQLPLSPAQQDAFNSIHKQFQTKQVCLLNGVTSSGKTEIYIRLIREVIQAGGQVLYLLPEIALTTQITTRLRRIFGDAMGVYHSKFPDNERVEIFQKQLSANPYQLILGVRSSVFLPFRNLKLIIVDEEHETSYKQEEPAPRYNARDTAIVLATYYHAHTLLGTATPSLETFWNAKNGKYGYAELLTRFGDMMLPKIEVVDVKELLRTKAMKPPFSPRLEEEIAKALDAHEQVILFQNRRGYAPIVECPQCGWTPTCDYCDVTLTYHQDLHRMVCHYCGRSFEIPNACPSCGETHLKNFGFGTEKIEEEIKKRFPQARTSRLDLDTTRNKNAHENIINSFAAGKTDILIGTQMVSKGLDFDNVHVVGILDADTMLTRPDFRSFERSFQMMSQVAGRAGRRNKRGYVILQTKHADYPVIRQVVDNDYADMYEEQMEERQTFRYPPYYRLIYVYLKHRDNHIVEQAAQQLGTVLRQIFGERVLGPDKPAIARLQLLYIRKIALKIERNVPTSVVRQRLTQAVDGLKQTTTFNALRVYFDVDPI
jgi:primosomal protein N' (replication factor Y)